MWLNLVRNTEWSAFLDLFSPSFFEVLPPAALSGQAKELISNYVSRPRFLRVREELQESVENARFGLTMSGALPKNRSVAELPDATRRARAETVLRLFFHQLLRAETCVLDLRRRSFGIDDHGALVWNPAPLFVKWEQDFVPSVRDLYVGFYRDDEQTWRRGLEALQLEPAEALFRAHFGGVDGVQEFKLAEFQRTFHQAFVQCRDAGKRLHGNFLPLGLFLACLYEHLEALAVPLHTRALFREEWQRANQRASEHGRHTTA